MSWTSSRIQIGVHVTGSFISQLLRSHFSAKKTLKISHIISSQLHNFNMYHQNSQKKPDLSVFAIFNPLHFPTFRALFPRVQPPSHSDLSQEERLQRHLHGLGQGGPALLGFGHQRRRLVAQLGHRAALRKNWVLWKSM